MQRMPTLETLLQEFARRQGIATPLPDDRGEFEILFDPGKPVQCFERFGNLHLVSSLAMPPEPAAQRRGWFKRLMNYALHRLKHSRSTPAMSTDGSVTLLARWDLAGTSVDDLETRIEEYLNSIESYRNVLGTAEAPAPLEALPHSIVRP